MIEYKIDYHSLMLRKNAFRYFFVAALLYIFSFIANNEEFMKYIFIVWILGCSLYCVYAFRHNMGLMFMSFFVLYCNYSIIVGVYLDITLRPSELYNQITDQSIYYIGLRAIYVFITLITTLALSQNKKLKFSNLMKEDFIFDETGNDLIALLCWILTFAMFFYGFRLGAGGERGQTSAIAEYRIIPFVIGSSFSGSNRKIWKIMWMICVIATCALSLLGGNRIDVIAMIIAYFTIYNSNENRMKVFSIMLLGIVILSIVGSFRGEILNTMRVDVYSVLQGLSEKKLALDTAYFAYFPSLCAIELSSKIHSIEKFKLLGDQFLYSILGSNYSGSLLQNVTREHYIHYYGFVSPVYFYFWFKELGGFIFGIIVMFYIKMIENIHKNHNRIKHCIFVYFVSSTARWYIYGPFSIIRGTLLMVIMYIFLVLINSFSKEKK